MKTRIFPGIYILLVLLAATAIRCSENCSVTSTYYYWEPIFTSLDDLRSSVISTKPLPITAPGKIYFKDNYLYINEVGKGIHVIDNSDPSAPVAKSFIKIPGNFDLAIRNNILYADSYVDLVAIDITNVGHETEVARFKDMFTYYSNLNFYADPERGIVTDLREMKNVNIDASDCNSTWMPGGWRTYEGIYVMDASMQAKATAYSAPGNTTGIAGSLARFAVRDNHMYALDAHMLKVIDVTDHNAIQMKSSVSIGWDIETIFPAEDKLFIGSQSGLRIYDIAEPESPVELSYYLHVAACDPVVVEGDFAYVTLRTGNWCTGQENQLEVINISNPSSPSVVKIYPMTNPHGLGIENGTLFVCDGDAGLRVFDTADKHNLSQIAQYTDLRAVDLIPLGGTAMVIGTDGLYQYDYSDLSDIRFLSKLEISSGN